MSTADSGPQENISTPETHRSRAKLRLAIFVASCVLSVAGFLAFDYFYSAVILGATVSGGAHGYCFAKDPIRRFAFLPNCTCIRPWLGTTYEFDTNNLGFRDERIRDVPPTVTRPRVLILGDSAPEGMTSWQDSFIGRVAANFPQYEFLNSSVEGYSPSNYLNTARMVLDKGIDFDEAIVFVDISDAQDEAAFFRDVNDAGAVTIADQKVARTGWYSDLRLNITNHFLLTNDVFEFFERNLVRLGWYHLDEGHGGNEFDLERSAWTYRKVSDTELYEVGYAPLGLEGGINKERQKMDQLRELLAKHNIPISVVVYPWPAQLAHDTVDSRQVRIWREWCEGKCKRFVTLFPAFFAVKDECPPSEPGCWYLSHFIFGDTHYNSAGDAIVADVVSKSLNEIPMEKHQPQTAAADTKPADESKPAKGRRQK